MTETELLDDERVRKVGKVLQGMGYWYPSDGIVAVATGRGTYLNLAGETHDVRDAMRSNIRAALARLRETEAPGYVEPLNLEARLELQAQESRPEPKPRRHKPSRKH